MALSTDDIQKIARLARLEIAEQDITRYQSELDSILGLIEQMEAADTSSIEPMTNPQDASLRLRKDEVSETNQRDKFQQNAPAADKGLYLVPKVID